MKYLSRKWARKNTRRLLGLVGVFSICAMLLPLPFAPRSVDSSEKDLSEPFPCQNRPCGCQSAAQCWKECCCFTNSQKVAWAKSHNVKVPDFVLTAAKKEVTAKRNVVAAKGKSMVRVASSAADHCPYCDQDSVSKAPSSCCDETKSPATRRTGSCNASVSRKESGPAKQKKSASSKWVMAVYAAECQGHSPFHLCLSSSIVPAMTTLATCSSTTMEKVTLESERLIRTSLQPPLLPPKIV